MSNSPDAVHHTARQDGHTLASHAAPSSTELARVTAGREDTYTVQRGDTLSEIAERCLGDAHRWPDIFALNRVDSGQQYRREPDPGEQVGSNRVR
ncbi:MULTISPECIES: LysM peptidoglycan-binding domain-containing protein [unclassified Micromonospora]|uniref:LysM peptidoglycan-binding domain-containing protein n=1 Tax=unclassified Micromonospora TaxID=2617518 RepID=UPI0033B8E069